MMEETREFVIFMFLPLAWLGVIFFSVISLGAILEDWNNLLFIHKILFGYIALSGGVLSVFIEVKSQKGWRKGGLMTDGFCLF